MIKKPFRISKNGRVIRPRVNTLDDVLGRLIRQPDGCWTWPGAIGGGYGQVRIDGQQRVVHLFVWECMRGPVPEGKQIDHLCFNKLCANPDHLEPVTGSENTRRGIRHWMLTTGRKPGPPKGSKKRRRGSLDSPH